MNGNQKIKFNRNKKKSKIMGTSSRNELMEKNDSNKNDNNENISFEEIKEKQSINKNQRRIIFMDQKDEINSSTSKRSNENKLLLRNNLNRNFKNIDFNDKFPRNKIETYTFYKNNFNKNTIEPINLNETENYVDDKDSKDDDISFNLNKINNEENEDNSGIKIEEIFNLIVGYNFNKVINSNYLRIFFLSPVPEDKTLSMNINQMNKKEKNSSNLNFKYLDCLEIKL